MQKYTYSGLGAFSPQQEKALKISALVAVAGVLGYFGYRAWKNRAPAPVTPDSSGAAASTQTNTSSQLVQGGSLRER